MCAPLSSSPLLAQFPCYRFVAKVVIMQPRLPLESKRVVHIEQLFPIITKTKFQKQKEKEEILELLEISEILQRGLDAWK